MEIHTVFRFPYLKERWTKFRKPKVRLTLEEWKATLGAHRDPQEERVCAFVAVWNFQMMKPVAKSWLGGCSG